MQETALQVDMRQMAQAQTWGKHLAGEQKSETSSDSETSRFRNQRVPIQKLSDSETGRWVGGVGWGGVGI